MPETLCGFDDVQGGASGSSLLVEYGPTLKVNIGFDVNWKPNSGIPPVAGIKDVAALVDTGAKECCIDNLLAIQLNLPVIDDGEVAGSYGRHPVKIYLAQIHIPSLDGTVYGRFAGVKLIEGGQVQGALIGRTFLQNYTMLYEGGTGMVKLSSPV